MFHEIQVVVGTYKRRRRRRSRRRRRGRKEREGGTEVLGPGRRRRRRRKRRRRKSRKMRIMVPVTHFYIIHVRTISAEMKEILAQRSYAHPFRQKCSKYFSEALVFLALFCFNYMVKTGASEVYNRLLNAECFMCVYSDGVSGLFQLFLACFLDHKSVLIFLCIPLTSDLWLGGGGSGRGRSAVVGIFRRDDLQMKNLENYLRKQEL